MKLLAGIAMSFQRQKAAESIGGGVVSSGVTIQSRRRLMDRAHSPALQEMRRRRRVPKRTSAMPISSIYYETRVCTGPFPKQFADDHLRRFLVAITNDRTQTIFALHESAFGTKRTYRGKLAMSALRG